MTVDLFKVGFFPSGSRLVCNLQFQKLQTVFCPFSMIHIWLPVQWWHHCIMYMLVTTNKGPLLKDHPQSSFVSLCGWCWYILGMTLKLRKKLLRQLINYLTDRLSPIHHFELTAFYVVSLAYFSDVRFRNAVRGVSSPLCLDPLVQLLLLLQNLWLGHIRVAWWYFSYVLKHNEEGDSDKKQ